MSDLFSSFLPTFILLDPLLLISHRRAVAHFNIFHHHIVFCDNNDNFRSILGQNGRMEDVLLFLIRVSVWTLRNETDFSTRTCVALNSVTIWWV